MYPRPTIDSRVRKATRLAKGATITTSTASVISALARTRCPRSAAVSRSSAPCSTAAITMARKSGVRKGQAT